MLELIVLGLVIVCALFAAATVVVALLAYQVIRRLMEANNELQLEVLALSKDTNAQHYAGFRASAEENRRQVELLESLRKRGGEVQDGVEG